jgi:hypothetical protein
MIALQLTNQSWDQDSKKYISKFQSPDQSVDLLIEIVKYYWKIQSHEKCEFRSHDR